MAENKPKKPKKPQNPESKPEKQGRLSEAEIRRKQQNPNEAVGDQMEDRPRVPRPKTSPGA